MSLHLLPPTKIEKMFSKLKKKAAKLKIVLLDKFFNYIENTWLQQGSCGKCKVFQAEWIKNKH
jgi:hypothetical protein